MIKKYNLKFISIIHSNNLALKMIIIYYYFSLNNYKKIKDNLSSIGNWYHSNTINAKCINIISYITVELYTYEILIINKIYRKTFVIAN